MNIFVISLGCSKNLVDTEVMLGHLAAVGARMVDAPEDADCLLVNTCAFLTEAVEEALDRIVELARLKGHGKVNRLVVTGCLVSRYGDRLLKEIPEIDALVHPASLPEVARAVSGQASPLQEGPFAVRLRSAPAHRAYLKVGEGCSNHCSYCLIPSLRGEFVSRPLESLVEEARWLLDDGVRELVLVSQDTGRYGTDRGSHGLADLVRSLLGIGGRFWLRVLYVHPSRVDRPLLKAMASDPRVCRYLDVPFQHVSPAVLSRMGRASAPPPAEVLGLIRSELPGAFLRTTLMTGFPGETEGDFRSLLDFVLRERLHHVGVFPYSREEGTAAAGMGGQVDGSVARERADRLMAAQSEVSAALLRDAVGTELEVMGEGADEDGPFGRHQGQAPEVDGVVRLDREVAPGEVVRVRVQDSGAYDLAGEVL